MIDTQSWSRRRFMDFIENHDSSERSDIIGLIPQQAVLTQIPRILC